MRLKFGFAAPVAMAVLLVTAVACGDDISTSSQGLNTPDIQATVTALALSQAQALAPTPVPANVRQELLAFAAGHKSASDNWDLFHQGMDQWRDDVAACVPASFESALDAYAGRALGITQTVRSLDRLPSLDTMAARLTAAAEQEAAAFDALRNNWRPERGLSAGSSSQAPGQTPGLFQQVSSVRSSVDLERRNIARSLLARQTSLDEASLNRIESFAANLEILNSDWDKFHREYDAFRVEQVQLGDDAAATRLGGLITQFGLIVSRVQDLPRTLLTQEIADRLTDAADGEQLLLRRLLGSIGGDGSLVEMAAVLPEDLAITEAVDGETDSSGLAINNATIFDVFNTQIAVVNRLRRTLHNDLSDARASLTTSGQQNLNLFLGQARELELEWDEFHDSYDDWRQTNGGCDQSQALEALGQLATDFDLTVQDIRKLSTAPLVRNLGDILLQAVEREQAAVLSLRESWRPLDTGAFGRYTADRSFSETLRRQVAVELQDLLASQGMPEAG